MEAWTIQEVKNWLESQELDDISQVLERSGVCGKDLVHADDEKLAQFGLKRARDRVVVLKYLEDLKEIERKENFNEKASHKKMSEQILSLSEGTVGKRKTRHSSKMSASSDITQVDEEECETHGEVYYRFCKTDHVPICPECIDLHLKHDIVTLDEMKAEAFSQTVSLEQLITTHLKQLTAKRDAMKNDLNNFGSAGNKTLAQLRETFKALRELLDKQEAVAVDSFKNVLDKAKDPLKHDIGNIDKILLKGETLKGELTRSMASSNDIPFRTLAVQLNYLRTRCTEFAKDSNTAEAKDWEKAPDLSFFSVNPSCFPEVQSILGSMIQIVLPDDLEGILSVMKVQNEHTALILKCCSKLETLAKSDDMRDKIREAGGIELVIKSLKKHHNNEKILERGLGAIWNLGKSETNRDEIREREGLQVIIETMNAYQSDEVIQTKALGALWNLAVNETNRDVIRKLKGIESIVTAMQKHLGCSSVQENGCGALWNLAVTSKNDDVIRGLKGIEVILSGMKAHVADALVQEQGCAAIRNICYNNDENAAIVRVSQGLEVILAAMKAFHGNSKVLEQAIGALWNLSINDKNEVMIGQLKGLEEIVKALNHHRDNVGLQEQGCGALWSLTSTASNRQLALTAGAYDAAVHAIREYGTDEAIFENAVGLLRNIAQLPEVRAMLSNNPKVLELIVGTCSAHYASNPDVVQLVAEIRLFLEHKR